MKTYTVLSPLRRDGTEHAPGTTLEMPEQDAGPLVKCGVLGEADATQKKEAVGKSAAAKTAKTGKAETAKTGGAK